MSAKKTLCETRCLKLGERFQFFLLFHFTKKSSMSRLFFSFDHVHLFFVVARSTTKFHFIWTSDLTILEGKMEVNESISSIKIYIVCCQNTFWCDAYESQSPIPSFCLQNRSSRLPNLIYYLVFFREARQGCLGFWVWYFVNVVKKKGSVGRSSFIKSASILVRDSPKFWKFCDILWNFVIFCILCDRKLLWVSAVLRFFLAYGILITRVFPHIFFWM